jgi:hypothetical protein
LRIGYTDSQIVCRAIIALIEQGPEAKGPWQVRDRDLGQISDGKDEDDGAEDVVGSEDIWVTCGRGYVFLPDCRVSD